MTNTSNSSDSSPSRVERFNMESIYVTDPEALTDKELLRMPQKFLSRELPPKTSSHSIMKVYLRWLDIQRQNPTAMTEHWNNTTMHWAQSLDARGFTEKEVVNAVARWLDDHEPREIISGRQFPTVEDIAQAFKTQPKKRRKISSLLETEGDSWRPKNEERERSPREQKREMILDGEPPNPYGRPPPGNYVCNRCGKRGHHLQVCPTNMDPKYDRPPTSNYFCELCGKKGVHFRSICPLNEDPFSINQKRKRAKSTAPVRESPNVMTDRQRMKEKLREEGELTPRSESSGSWDINPVSQGNSPSPDLSEMFEGLESPAALAIDSEESTPKQSITTRQHQIHWGRNSRNRIKELEHVELTTSREPSNRRASMLEKPERKRMALVGDSPDGYGGPDFKEDSTAKKRPREDDLSPDHSGLLPGTVEQSSVDGSGKWHEKRARLDKLSEILPSAELDIQVEDLLASTRHPPHQFGRLNNDEMDIDEPATGGVAHDFCQQISGEPDVQAASRSGMESLQIENITLDVSESEGSDGMKIDPIPSGKIPKTRYSGFVQKLVRRHPALMNIVNTIKPRTTALEKWKKASKSGGLGVSGEQEGGLDINSGYDNMMNIGQHDGGNDMNGDKNHPSSQHQFNIFEKVKKFTEKRSLFRTFSEADNTTSTVNKNIAGYMVAKKGEPEEKQSNIQTNPACSTMELARSQLALVESTIESQKVMTGSNMSANSLLVNLEGIRPPQRRVPDPYERYYVSEDDESDDDPTMPKFKSKGDKSAYMVMRSLHAMRLAKQSAINEMKIWSTEFKLDFPVPEDLLPLLTKDPIKQQKILKRCQGEDVSTDNSSEDYYDGFSDIEDEAASTVGTKRPKANRSVTLSANAQETHGFRVNGGQTLAVINSNWAPTLARVDSIIGRRPRTISFAPRITFADQLASEPEPDIRQELKVFGATFKIPTSLGKSRCLNSRTLGLAY